MSVSPLSTHFLLFSSHYVKHIHILIILKSLEKYGDCLQIVENTSKRQRNEHFTETEFDGL